MSCDFAEPLSLPTLQIILRVWMNDTAFVPEQTHILLVDDDQELRDAMHRVLVQAGFNVAEAESGETAAALIHTGISFEMLVTDVRMPGQYDGVALASCWREKVPGCPVLFVSGQTDVHLAVGTLGPHEAVLQKPFQRASLLDAVQSLLAQRLTAATPAQAESD